MPENNLPTLLYTLVKIVFNIAIIFIELKQICLTRESAAESAAKITRQLRTFVILPIINIFSQNFNHLISQRYQLMYPKEKVFGKIFLKLLVDIRDMNKMN